MSSIRSDNGVFYMSFINGKMVVSTEEISHKVYSSEYCPICWEFIEQNSLEVTACGHFYCKPCIGRYKATQRSAGKTKWSCATCRKEHTY